MSDVLNEPNSINLTDVVNSAQSIKDLQSVFKILTGTDISESDIENALIKFQAKSISRTQINNVPINSIVYLPFQVFSKSPPFVELKSVGYMDSKIFKCLHHEFVWES
jgi:hypothetical protein